MEIYKQNEGIPFQDIRNEMVKDNKPLKSHIDTQYLQHKNWTILLSIISLNRWQYGSQFETWSFKVFFYNSTCGRHVQL
jgi:hypothetical protein